ncbi:hypothetical protein JOF53_001435 [Crossiella equi]|uniref:DUF6879 domain-containing protein n=1 Tax=Crossiella equi TaxID=130796 RepID=A0ABS5A7K0_9PSEU|nr:DUF6879 family protein [Crossiella equi]MBP2472563.1 hypothetical protein [Crossiella equi]
MEGDFARLRDGGFWKLERQQHFAEPDNPSWRAFHGGDWGLARQRLAAMREEFTAYYRRALARGVRHWRVRVVELPLTPYLHWELHVLRLRVACGANARVVGPEQVRALERDGPLPEVFTLGTRVLYQARYDEHGVLAGGRRRTGAELVARWQRTIAGLYQTGQELVTFFEREVAGRSEPRGG